MQRQSYSISGGLQMQRYGKRLVCCSIAFCIGDILHIERRTIEHKFLISMFALLLTDYHKRYGSRDSGDTKTYQPSPKI